MIEIKSSRNKGTSAAPRPSRIRRDPLLVKPIEKKVEPRSREMEISLGLAGVLLFAVTITLATVGFSIITASSHSQAAEAAPAPSQQFLRCGIGDGPNCVIDAQTIRMDGERLTIARPDAGQGSSECGSGGRSDERRIERLLQLLNSGTVKTGARTIGPDGGVRTRVTVNGEDVGAALAGDDQDGCTA